MTQTISEIRKEFEEVIEKILKDREFFNPNDVDFIEGYYPFLRGLIEDGFKAGQKSCEAEQKENVEKLKEEIMIIKKELDEIKPEDNEQYQKIALQVLLLDRFFGIIKEVFKEKRITPSHCLKAGGIQ